VGLLNTFASVVALEVGRWAHDQIILCGWDLGALVCSRLVDMYAECGNFGGCLEILQKMAYQDVVTWNAMIGTCPMGVQMMKMLQHATPSPQLGS
jgi:hypothetical protein